MVTLLKKIPHLILGKIFVKSQAHVIILWKITFLTQDKSPKGLFNLRAHIFISEKSSEKSSAAKLTFIRPKDYDMGF